MASFAPIASRRLYRTPAPACRACGTTNRAARPAAGTGHRPIGVEIELDPFPDENVVQSKKGNTSPAAGLNTLRAGEIEVPVEGAPHDTVAGIRDPERDSVQHPFPFYAVERHGAAVNYQVFRIDGEDSGQCYGRSRHGE
jgi:hypothetical protein